MTSKESREFYETFGPEFARRFLEGDRLRVHAVKASLVCEGGKVCLSIDALPRDGHPEEWERVTRKICRILKREMDRVPPKTKTVLSVLVHTMPDTPLFLFKVETYLSVLDDGSSGWDVLVYLSLVAGHLPDMVEAAERVRERVLEVVTKV